MASKITLTVPLSPDALRAAYPRALLAVEDPEIEAWLEIEEHALRSQFGVLESSSASDAALRRAMIASWPSFHAQVRQISQESSSTKGHSVAYARGGEPFTFPAFVSTILRAHIDADAGVQAPTTTELVRECRH